jgi:hypothetical protein
VKQKAADQFVCKMSHLKKSVINEMLYFSTTLVRGHCFVHSNWANKCFKVNTIACMLFVSASL